MATKPVSGKTIEIKLAHSPDSDDAFMFYGLATQKVRTPGLKFAHVLADIETLNQAARQEIYDVTAFSFGAYPYLRDKYALLDCGASFGEGYGPIVVSQHPMKREDLTKCRIAVPGLQTSAYLTLRLYEPRVEPVVMAFDQILDAVKNSVVDAGLLIHEGNRPGFPCRLAAMPCGAPWGERSACRSDAPSAKVLPMPWTIANPRSIMPCNSRATWNRSWPTSLSVCM